jgi:uncharacterized membrane protein
VKTNIVTIVEKGEIALDPAGEVHLAAGGELMADKTRISPDITIFVLASVGYISYDMYRFLKLEPVIAFLLSVATMAFVMFLIKKYYQIKT